MSVEFFAKGLLLAAASVSVFAVQAADWMKGTYVRPHEDDVTPFLRAGAENELRVELGNGLWNLVSLKMWYVYDLWKILPQGEPAVRETLDIRYPDGSGERMETDTRWSAGKVRIVKNSIYLGVKEDVRLPSGDGWGAAQKAGRLPKWE